MRIVLDTTILVRATEASQGIARQVLLAITKSPHTLLLSNEMLYELARVLRYPRLLALHGLEEKRIYDFIGFLREVAELVTLDPLVIVPIRDAKDIMVAQTAVSGDADILCTRDEDFFDVTMAGFLRALGIEVMDDIALIQRLR